eukprot:CAMPEP_0198289990 /NCGR_PEP_ID=MMETSP1449-20131203/7998_1 /TAXON_ID=420275 /ORGANISM="Attheya septentrionalis, Strain CCMP2084" /LENGTH=251 /DNA_ID=CAMNT_0043988401 /DNA_START=138 /DNA_END=893 /DNA_ORIENTATION=-
MLTQTNDSISCSCSWTQQQDRFFSSKKRPVKPRLVKRTLQSANNGPGAGPLANEHLIAALLDGGRGRPKRSANSVEVRLVLDQKANDKSSVQVLSLMQAVELSTQESLDLVGINLTQKPPVIKATDFGKLMFEKKKSNAAASSKRHSEAKSLKEFQFKAGVAANDLDRKAALMVDYLIKGHNCRVTISSNWKNLNRDQNALLTTLERVRTLVGDTATEARGFVVNERGNRATLLLSPNAQSITVKQKRKEL